MGKWTSQKSLTTQLEKLWCRGLLLKAFIDASEIFPLRLVFKSPDSKDLTHEFNAVRNWVAEIQKLNGYRIVYKTIRHRVTGENTLPCEAWVDTPEAAASLLNRRPEVAAFSNLLEHTRQRADWLIDWIRQYPLKALTLVDSWSKLLDFVLWCQQHPRPDIYLRQVNLPGIDSKFIEQHRSVLTQLLDLSLPASQINREASGIKNFEQRFGFRHKPGRVRFRLLDPALTLLPGTDYDISISAADFNALSQKHEFSDRIQHVFITENEVNFLAFPPRQNSLVIFGGGYGFEALAQAAWLLHTSIFYWGDIDTHGFAILDQLRSKFPYVQSLLMDEATLLDHRLFWGKESKAENRVLPRLTSEEQTVYAALVCNTHQTNLRLEQERIPFNYLIAAVADIG